MNYELIVINYITSTSSALYKKLNAKAQMMFLSNDYVFKTRSFNSVKIENH